MKMVKFTIASLMILGMISASGCIWVTDNHNDDREHVTYINHTTFSVDCWIDDVFQATVLSQSELTLSSRHLDGRHVFYSRTTNGEIEWGPTYFVIDQGGELVLDLYDQGW